MVIYLRRGGPTSRRVCKGATRCASALLTKVEMRSPLVRRRREGSVDAEAEGRVLATFEGDIAMGFLVLLPHTVESFLVAESLLGSSPGPLSGLWTPFIWELCDLPG